MQALHTVATAKDEEKDPAKDRISDVGEEFPKRDRPLLDDVGVSNSESRSSSHQVFMIQDVVVLQCLFESGPPPST